MNTTRSMLEIQSARTILKKQHQPQVVADAARSSSDIATEEIAFFSYFCDSRSRNKQQTYSTLGCSVLERARMCASKPENLEASGAGSKF